MADLGGLFHAFITLSGPLSLQQYPHIQTFARMHQYLKCTVVLSLQAHTVDCSVPQGSVLGPLSFVAYTDDISGVVERQHGVSLHQYADDKQLFASARLDRMSVKNWCASR